MVSISMM